MELKAGKLGYHEKYDRYYYFGYVNIKQDMVIYCVKYRGVINSSTSSVKDWLSFIDEFEEIDANNFEDIFLFQKQLVVKLFGGWYL